MNILRGCSILTVAAVMADSQNVFAQCVDYESRASWRGHIAAQTTVTRLQLLGNYAFTSEGVFDVSNPSAPERVEVQWPVEPNIRDVHGALAFVTLQDSSLVAVDASDPLDATQLARVRLPGVARLLAAGDGFACLTLWNQPGVRIYTLLPDEARFVATWLVPWTVRALAIEGHIVYLLDEEGFLHLFDVTNIHSPHEVSHLEFFWGYAIDVEAGLLAFNSYYGIVLVDVRDPANPTPLRSLDPYGGEQVRRSGNLVAWLGYGGLIVADISDPRAPRRIGSFDLAGHLYLGIAMLGNRAVVSYDFFRDYRHSAPPPGIHVFDLTLDGAIEPIATVSLDYSYVIGAANHLAYVATEAGLQIVDLTQPAAPVPRGRIAVAWRPADVLIAGTLAYIAAFDHGPIVNFGFYIVDVSNADAPQLLGEVPGSAVRVAVQGDHAYVVSDSDFRVIDISNPVSPRVVGEIPLQYATSVALHGERAFVGTMNGMRVIDIAHPDAPLIVREDGGPVADVGIDDRFLYIARGSRLEIRSLDDVDGAFISSYSFPFEIGRIAVASATAYVSLIGHAIHALDLSNPQAPRLLGVIDPPQATRDLELLGERLLTSDGIGLAIYPQPCTAATPVLLSDFTAQEDGDAIHLQWHASDADEIVEFIIRRLDERGDREIARLPAREPMEYRDRNVEAGVLYTYRVIASLANGSEVASAAIVASWGRPRFALSPAWPNPAPGRTSLQFTLPATGNVQLDIFDVAGRRVRRVFEGPAAAGNTVVRWDGRTQSGRAAARGAYVARLVAAHGTRTTRFVLGGANAANHAR